MAALATPPPARHQGASTAGSQVCSDGLERRCLEGEFVQVSEKENRALSDNQTPAPKGTLKAAVHDDCLTPVVERTMPSLREEIQVRSKVVNTFLVYGEPECRSPVATSNGRRTTPPKTAPPAPFMPSPVPGQMQTVAVHPMTVRAPSVLASHAVPQPPQQPQQPQQHVQLKLAEYLKSPAVQMVPPLSGEQPCMGFDAMHMQQLPPLPGPMMAPQMVPPYPGPCPEMQLAADGLMASTGSGIMMTQDGMPHYGNFDSGQTISQVPTQAVHHLQPLQFGQQQQGQQVFQIPQHSLPVQPPLQNVVPQQGQPQYMQLQQPQQIQQLQPHQVHQPMPQQMQQHMQVQMQQQQMQQQIPPMQPPIQMQQQQQQQPAQQPMHMLMHMPFTAPAAGDQVFSMPQPGVPVMPGQVPGPMPGPTIPRPVPAGPTSAGNADRQIISVANFPEMGAVQ